MHQSVAADFFKVAVDGTSRRHIELRKRILDFVQFDVAPLGKLHRPRHHLRVLREDAQHLFRGLHIELVSVEAKPLLVVDGAAGLHAQQDIVGMMIVMSDVVAIVSRDQRNVEIFFQAEQIGVDLLLELQPLVLNLQEEIAPPEDVLVSFGRRARRVVVALHQVVAKLARQAPGKSNQPL